MFGWLKRLMGGDEPLAAASRVRSEAEKEAARQQIADQIERTFSEFEDMLPQEPKPTRQRIPHDTARTTSSTDYPKSTPRKPRGRIE